jgi:anaerobic ribonucleoside-triphosphate reductase activating protein
MKRTHQSIQLNQIQYPVHNLGEGVRLGIWLQGCTLGCKGCVSKSLWNAGGGKAVDVLALALQIEQVQGHFDGITITGGEPFQQYASLMALCIFLKKRTDLSVWIYTGYYLEELEGMFPDKLYLRCVDVLVDGRYEQSLHSDDNARGSTNQSIYAIKNGQAERWGDYAPTSQWGLTVTDDFGVHLTGIPKEGELQDIEQQLESLGVAIKFSKW